MGLMKYLGGIGLYLLGGFLIFVALVSSFFSYEVCIVIGIIGIVILLSGVFYTRTSTYDVPKHIKIVDREREKVVKEDIKKIDENALDILKKRYAKGEITKKEFEDMKKDLE